ncbi:MAG TPA: hypothetical protein VLC48_05130 [Gemmatimonadota bacterium]|nr:hypothetical protein [Gemmatimonadota bacterium]
MEQQAHEVDRLYRERARRFAEQSAACARRSRALSHARLAAFIAAGAAAIWLLEPGGGTSGRLALAGVLGAVFLGLVAYQRQVDRRCRQYGDLSRLNQEGLARRARDWNLLTGGTADDLGPQPAFAADLDLFGHASLFSLLGTVSTAPGTATLRGWLLEPAPAGEIEARQAAVRDLAPLVELRQEITLGGRTIPSATPVFVARFLDWAEDEPWLRSHRWVIWTARALAGATATLVALNIAGMISYTAWLTAAAVNLAFSYTVGRKVHRIFDRAFARESAFQRYADILQRMTTASFAAPKLQQLQAEMSSDGVPAYRQMERLHRLSSLADVRLSMAYAAIQAFTLWDFHVLARLEGWQATAGRQARRWLAALGEFDALAALGGLSFDNPTWAFPSVADDGRLVVQATAMGHPLLPDHVRVANDVAVGPPGTFLLITGSNMSGKSTLLRAIGTNVVLARAGGPVCATSMSLPPVRLETSMRVHDSLRAGLSHFMAELQRLKHIVGAADEAEAGEAGTPLLYLLDDIFQGTNTAERQIAARKVIAHLLAAGAIGAVTSHDLALADTDELSRGCDPVHFTESIEEAPSGARITFDYRLRPGVATSRNAIKLLEIVGLDLRPDASAQVQDGESSAD